MKFVTAIALASACTTALCSNTAAAQAAPVENPIRHGFDRSIFIAHQGRKTEENMEMYGVVRTDSFLFGGSVYVAGTPSNNVYNLDTFLTRTEEILTWRMNNQIAERFPNHYQQAVDPRSGLTYFFVPAERFNGLVIMDIEGENLVVHPDKLLNHYLHTNWNGLTGHALVNRMMEQYGLCAMVTKRALPGASVGLFGIVTSRRNGTSSEEYVRKVNFFKQKAAAPENWLRDVDYLCPTMWSAWAPMDEIVSCQASGNTIRDCAARYYGAIDVAIGAFTRGPLIDYTGCNGNPADPYSGCANVTPNLWLDPDPVRDVTGRAFKICLLLTVQVRNQASCAHERFLVEPDVDPGLHSTLRVFTAYLNDLVFVQNSYLVDCYAFWTPGDIPFGPTRLTMNALPFPLLGDYTGDGRVDAADDLVFQQSFEVRHPRADLNADGVVDRIDRMIMDIQMNNNRP
ncbi:MAG: hypothetical protein KF757_10520 [Phycisphaeraceae bacterium]|nr:hypothetical protein [Phycisphaeraceae bacterium]MCW5764085.1 hypothetical protein [Phycisphaeraceae bacterium]